MGIIKRFVAGAVCPDCQQLDTLVIYTEQKTKVFECVECGYHNELRPEQSDNPSASSDSMIQWLTIQSDDPKTGSD